jgi:hypothetical protein
MDYQDVFHPRPLPIATNTATPNGRPHIIREFATTTFLILRRIMICQAVILFISIVANGYIPANYLPDTDSTIYIPVMV